MKRISISIALLLSGAAAALAQDAPDAVEVGMSYSFTNPYPGNGTPSFLSSGGSGTFVYNFNHVLSAVADLGAYHNPNIANFNPTTFTYLFGPRVSIRRSRLVTPYFQALFGGARQWTSFVDPNTGSMAPQNGFAAAFGGGMDIRVHRHILLKPFQVDYLMTRVTNPWTTAGTQNNLRYSAGVVFTFGAK